MYVKLFTHNVLRAKIINKMYAYKKLLMGFYRHLNKKRLQGRLN